MSCRFVRRAAAVTAAVVLPLLALWAGNDRPASFRVVGYLPDYRVAAVEPAVARHLTDLIYFSVEPDAGGGIDRRRLTPEQLAKLHKIKEQGRLSLLLCVGGWGRSGAFARVSGSPEARDKFAAAAVRFCVDNRFDGIDVDWEHPATPAQEQDYAALLVALKKALAAKGLSLSVALAGWQHLSAEGIAAVDRIHLMAYDAPGRHATLAFARDEVARAVKNGVPREKICLGVPFYGRHVTQPGKALPYAEIARKYRPGPDVDEVDGYYFNGLRTIERKARFARRDGLGGVMVWELGQDAAGERSLLSALARAAADKGE